MVHAPLEISRHPPSINEMMKEVRLWPRLPHSNEKSYVCHCLGPSVFLSKSRTIRVYELSIVFLVINNMLEVPSSIIARFHSQVIYGPYLKLSMLLVHCKFTRHMIWIWELWLYKTCSGSFMTGAMSIARNSLRTATKRCRLMERWSSWNRFYLCFLRTMSHLMASSSWTI